MLIKFCNRVIEYSFYAIFLLVPLSFSSATSELFEMNKMWLTWGLTIIIAMSWLIKMVLQKKFVFQRTPLDIPIGLFLLSQIISTIFSLDPHVSLWGYYSRFNGGLLSIISYILLYYAFLSNLAHEKHENNVREFRENVRDFSEISAIKMVKRLLSISLISGLIVALWGLPSHFGYDPTCYIFRGTFDVSCWTADFLPKVRIFSTLGQPDWLAAYLAILIPIAIAFPINNLKSKSFIRTTCYVLLATLFYIDLLYTRARSGFLGILGALIFFATAYFFTEIRNKQKTISKNLPLIPCLLLLITFVIGTPVGQLDKFTLKGIVSHFQKPAITKSSLAKAETPVQPIDTGGTESANIRANVWKGAITAWKAHPFFGTGVETYAFAYYKYKPAAQNLTSEWDFLYNKAHNEYLNYLATTGLFGLGTYLLMIGIFITTVMLNLFQHLNNQKNEILNSSKRTFLSGGGAVQDNKDKLLILAFLAGYISILITNFFGFSVVITNIYLFMIPAFVLVLTKSDLVLTQQLKTKTTPIQTNKAAKIETGASIWQLTPIFFIFVTGCWLLVALFRFWQADIAYALGANLDRAGQFQQAYPNLHKAVEIWGTEPVFKDELSINDATVAIGLVSQKPKDSSVQKQALDTASALAQEAIDTNNALISQHQNNAVFWKTRVRLFYTLSQADSRYLPRALDAIEKAALLAPNDAKIWYNLGALYGQNNNLAKGIEALEKTIILKPDYRDAHYALGLFYHTQSLNKKAIAQMQYILDHIAPKDADAQKSITEWTK